MISLVVFREKTFQYYQEYKEFCDCLSCKYYYENIEGQYPELEDFFRDYSIDITKPVEVIEYSSDNSDLKLYSACYLVCGFIDKLECRRIGNLEIRFLKGDSFFKVDMDGDYFLIEVFGINL